MDSFLFNFSTPQQLVRLSMPVNKRRMFNSFFKSTMSLIPVLVCVLLSGQIFAQSLDYTTLQNINKNRNNGSESMMELLNNSDYALCAAVPVFQFITFYSTNHGLNWEDTKQSVLAFGYDIAFTEMFKYSLQRDRPYTTYPSQIKAYRNNTDPSFPSGHVSMAFANATSLSIRYRKWYYVVPAYAWAGAVGYSQMYLGMHYPSDVLAGAIVGAGSAWLSLKTNQWINNRKTARQFMQ